MSHSIAKEIRDEEEAAAKKLRDEEMNRMEKQLKQLIGYNCNQDMNLENIDRSKSVV